MKAPLHGSPKKPPAHLFGFAHLSAPFLPSIEGFGQALVPDPVGNGPAGLLAVVELQPGVPGGGHRLILQPD